MYYTTPRSNLHPVEGLEAKKKSRKAVSVCVNGGGGGAFATNLTHSGVDACECPEKRVSLAMLDGNKEALGDDVDEFFSGQYR